MFRGLLREFSTRRDEVRSVTLVSFYLATVLTLTASGTPYLGNIMTGDPDAAGEFLEDLLWMSIWLYAWLLIVPVVYLVSARLNAGQLPLTRQVGVYLVWFVYAYVVHVGIQIAAMLLPAYSDVHPTMVHAVIHHMLSGVYLIAITYGGVAASCHAIAAHRRAQELQLHRAREESDRVNARMHALRSQLQPHFLFNALNSVSTLMYRDVHAADEMLAGIGDLMRILIKDTDRPLITLREEMDFIEMYLKVEKHRYGDRLQVEFDYADSLREALVPALVLQPVVENAIKHGTSKLTRVGRIRISAKRDDESLVLAVSDNGPGLATGDGAAGSGVGIANLRARLRELYDSEQSLRMTSTVEGAHVEIVIPFQRANKEQRQEVR